MSGRGRVVVLLVLSLFFLCGRAWAVTSTTILNNGPTSDKVDLVMISEGYTAAQMAKWATDAQTIMNAFFSEPPFSDYKRFFNVHRVDLISNQSGADHPILSIAVDTALDATYNCGNIERLICVSSVKTQAAANAAPAKDIILVVVNDTEYGGSGGSVAVVSLASGSVEIALHEVGHSFGHLADEYADGCTTYTGPEPSQPNATVDINRSTLKWGEWVLPTTLLPTSLTTIIDPGAYEGCLLCFSGVYRPTHDSKMRTLGEPFETVNYNALVKSVFDYVPPDLTAPAASMSGSKPVGTKTTITLTASDPESNVRAYRLSNTNVFTGSTWKFASNQLTFSTSVSWTLALSTQTQVFAQVMNGDGGVANISCVLDFTAPSVSLDSPANGATVSGTYTVTATATDNVGVDRVDFYVDGVLKSSDTTSAYTFSWDTTAVSNGSHTLQAKGLDTAGNVGSSSIITVTVSNVTNTSVSITTPSDGATVSGTVNITASITGTPPTSVKFYVDGVLKLTKTAAPWSYSWPTGSVVDGPHTVVAKAYNSTTLLATSPTINVILRNVAIDPRDGVTVWGLVPVSATVASNLTVTKVLFYVNGSLKNTDTTAPYSFTWDTRALANGVYYLQAKAYNGSTLVGTSFKENVSVKFSVMITSPRDGATVSGIIAIASNAAENPMVGWVQLMRDGFPTSVLLPESKVSPFTLSFNTSTVPNGRYLLMLNTMNSTGSVQLDTSSENPITVTISN